MMKRLAVFCDGTWSSLAQERRTETKGGGQETNVALLWRAASAAQDPAQTSAYFSGVGVGRLPLLGAIIGAGLDEKILEAYRWICQRYQFGDQVFLFGFSRGAYTVRSLAGLIRNVGFLKDPTPARARQAMALYRGRPGPDSPAAKRFRERHAAAYVESVDGAVRLTPAGGGASLPHAIAFLGVWDTVGALGVPHAWPFAMAINRSYDFHDASLSRMVAHAAHALAADERRRAFAPAAWTNLPALNAGLAAPRYRQEWFPGDHGSVGGGGPERRLSDGALLWIADQARAAGLTLDPDHPELERARRNADPIKGALANGGDKAGLGAFSALRDRAEMGPGDAAHQGALARMAADAAYRPAPLRRSWPKP